MEKIEFYTLFKEYAQKKGDSESEDREKNILSICRKHPELLIMPGYDKNYYGHAAALIFKLGYEKFKDHLEELFVWLQDINWPAANTISKFIASIPPDELIPHLKNILRVAYKDNDDFWIYGIYDVIRRAKLSKLFFADDELKKILEFGGCTEEEDIYDNFITVNFESEFQANLKECIITEFDLHFCPEEKMRNLIMSIISKNAAQTEEEKQKHQEVIISIRYGYKSKFNK